MKLAKEDATDISGLSDEDKKKLALAFAAALILEIGQEWRSLPLEIRSALENSALSGVGVGALQTGAGAKLLGQAKDIASEYARSRSLELVSLMHDENGELIPDPEAEMSIAATTENRIKEIVEQAFAGSASMDEVWSKVEAALQKETEGNGIFSQARAELIAEHEVVTAQTFGHAEAWTSSGVQKVRWSVTSDNPCSVCLARDGGVFDLEDLETPPIHCHCQCRLEEVVE